jgi:FkbM family methyltransferase
MTQLDLIKKKVYYSQNREDLVLEAFFPDVEKGFYVDVGANDPVVDSVTKLFYEKGWRGINIEPLKHHYEALKAQRPEDINLNIGVGLKRKTMVFNEVVSGDGLSTFLDDMAKDSATSDSIKNYPVQIETLSEVFKAHKVGKIHFLKIDVEGFEYEVLAGNDWDKYRPEVICIEANHIIKDWRPLLKTNNYKLAFSDGLNEYYTDASTSRQAQFDFVESVVINRGGGVRDEHYQIIKELDEQVRQEQEALQQAHLETQKLLHENHLNHLRAAVAEKALRSPMAFIKYQLKRVHRVTLRRLNQGKPVVDHTPGEIEARNKSLKKLEAAKSDGQRLEATQQLAKGETDRLERVYQTVNRTPTPLRAYLRLVGGVKQLRRRIH